MDEERITTKTLRESYNTLAFQQHIVEEETENHKDAKRQRKPEDSE
jgi:hypothetical protein